MLLSNVLLLDLFHYRLIDARCKWSTNVKGLMVDMIIVLSITVYFENLVKLISCPKWNETCIGTRMLIHDQWLLVKSLPLLIDKIVVDFCVGRPSGHETTFIFISSTIRYLMLLTRSYLKLNFLTGFLKVRKKNKFSLTVGHL